MVLVDKLFKGGGVVSNLPLPMSQLLYLGVFLRKEQGGFLSNVPKNEQNSQR